MTTNYVQSLTLYQAGAGNIIGATSVVLTSLADIYGNAITSMTPFGAIGYITLEPDTTNEEAAIFTGITVNSNGTVSLTGVSTILAQTPYTAASGLVRQHSGGTKVVITDNIAFWNTFANQNNANTFSQTQTFSVPPVSATDPTTSTQVANKHYVDTVAIAGAPNASTTVKGIVQEATQAQVDAGTAVGSTGADLYPTPALIRSKQRSDYVLDTGTADIYAIAPSPVITAYAAGQTFPFKVGNTNLTTTPTLNVNTLGAKTITKNGTAPMAVGDLVAGQIVEVVYDGTEFQMISPGANSPNKVSDEQIFTTSGTWTKPANLTGNELVIVQVWGAGGGGGTVVSAGDGAGGGGGGCSVGQFLASSLSATETVTVAGTTAAGTAGGNTTFGAHLTGFGGGKGATVTSSFGTGGGGGGSNSVGSDGSATGNTTGGAGGSLIGGPAGTNAPGAGGDSTFGGAGGGGNSAGGTSANGGSSIYGGGGGGSAANGAAGGNGGSSIYGGGGGGGAQSGVGGTSKVGGNGGAGGLSGVGTAGSAPAGGGGGSDGVHAGGTGGRGECRVFVIRLTTSS